MYLYDVMMTPCSGATIAPEYLRHLRNSVTEMLNNSIPDIFTFLSTTYGQLSPGELKEHENKINNLVYDLSHNADTVFNKIQEFEDLCTLF